jgi:hypothetical protein
MTQFLGFQILMEFTISEDIRKMEDHYAHVKGKYGANISFHRYKELRAALIPTSNQILQLCNILMTNTSK